MENILLAAGCSHVAGAEMDGTEDSEYNRQNSYSGILANMMGRKLVNIASHGSSNPTIARSVIEWFDENYNSETMDVFTVVGWTESSRIEIPTPHTNTFGFEARHWRSKTEKHFLRINMGWEGGTNWEREVMPSYHRFISENLVYLEVLSANIILQLQYFFQANKLDYLMSNTLHMFSKDKHLDFYLSQIQNSKYFNMTDNDESFYWKYRNMGYENPKAKYWHHDEIPHKLYAEGLYNFIKEQ
jgi:hypothetical protein